MYIRGMARQIIKQPDGNWCMYSTIIDNVIVENLTREEMISYVVEEKTRFAREECEKIISDLEDGKNPYNQFQMDYQYMNDLIKKIHGDDNDEC